jgi:hypothetical protein
VPQDINSDFSTKSAAVDGESPKVNKAPTLDTEETARSPRRPRAQVELNAPPVLEVPPSLPTRAALSPNMASASSSPEPAESPKTSPMSPGSYGLGAVGGYQHDEGSSMP